MADEMEATIYFCDPYKSYQKGGIGNGNRLLRTKLSLQTDLNILEQTAIDEIVDEFNQRPMKCLDYYTPLEVFYKYFELGHPQDRVALNA